MYPCWHTSRAPILSPLVLGYQEAHCMLQFKLQLIILTTTHKVHTIPSSWQMRKTKDEFSVGWQEPTRAPIWYKRRRPVECRITCFQKKKGLPWVQKCPGAPIGTCPVDGWSGAKSRPAKEPARELGVAVTGLGWLWESWGRRINLYVKVEMG